MQTHCLHKNSSNRFAWLTSEFTSENGEDGDNANEPNSRFKFQLRPCLFDISMHSHWDFRCHYWVQLNLKMLSQDKTYRNLGLILVSITKWGRVSSRTLHLCTWKPSAQIYSILHYCILFNFYDICRMKTDRMDNLTWIVYSTGLPLITQYSHHHCQWWPSWTDHCWDPFVHSDSLLQRQ